MGTLQRSKKFMSIDSLFYEEERLNTFINWPVPFLSPNDLAANGFYYLRTKDHCACAFCRGIVGAWEEGDTPEKEHKRHFPDCPLVLGLPTSNVPISQGRVLAEANLCRTPVKDMMSDTTTIEPGDPLPVGEDVCGKMETSYGFKPNMVTVCKAGEAATSVPLGDFGLKVQHQGPQRADFTKPEMRRKSFAAWPETVKISVERLVEAGFYYIGLSDHVRCYYCGNGLRNWEDNDDPWIEHARWYPLCQFVVLKKGNAFVEKVQEVFPPFKHTPPNEPSAYYSGTTQSKNMVHLTPDQLDHLMKLEVAQALIKQGFPEWSIRTALKEKVQESGVPFLMLAEAVDKTLNVLTQRDGADRWKELSISSKKWLGQMLSGESHGNPTHPPTETTQVVLPQPQEDTSFRQDNQESPSPLGSSTTGEDEPTPLEQDTPERVPLSSESDVLPGTSSQDEGSSQPADSQAEENSGESTPILMESKCINLADPLKEADVIMETAAKILRKEVSSPSTQALETPEEQSVRKEKLIQELMSEDTGSRDMKMCRVCMDADLEVVFLPCTHMVSCSSCALALTTCPICRGTISYALRPIMS